MYLADRYCCCFQLKGALDASRPFGVGDPFVEGSHFACAVVGDGGQGFAHDATRWNAEHGFVFGDELMQFAFDGGGVFFAFGFVAEVFDEADEFFEFAFGDVVCKGVDDDARFLDEGDVEDGVVGVAGEAGVVPEEDAVGVVFFGFDGSDHAVEVVAPDDGFAAPGIFINATKGEFMLYAVCLHFSELGKN